MKYILKGLFKLSVILSFRFYLPIESYLFQDIVLLLLLQRFHLPELFVISLLPYIYIQKAIAREDGKQEEKGRNIGKTHSETDTSNYLF